MRKVVCEEGEIREMLEVGWGRMQVKMLQVLIPRFLPIIALHCLPSEVVSSLHQQSRGAEGIAAPCVRKGASSCCTRKKK